MWSDWFESQNHGWVEDSCKFSLQPNLGNQHLIWPWRPEIRFPSWTRKEWLVIFTWLSHWNLHWNKGCPRAMFDYRRARGNRIGINHRVSGAQWIKALWGHPHFNIWTIVKENHGILSNANSDDHYPIQRCLQHYMLVNLEPPAMPTWQASDREEQEKKANTITLCNLGINNI